MTTPITNQIQFVQTSREDLAELRARNLRVAAPAPQLGANPACWVCEGEGGWHDAELGWLRCSACDKPQTLPAIPAETAAPRSALLHAEGARIPVMVDFDPFDMMQPAARLAM